MVCEYDTDEDTGETDGEGWVVMAVVVIWLWWRRCERFFYPHQTSENPDPKSMMIFVSPPSLKMYYIEDLSFNLE